MIPAFDADTGALPPGDHRATLEEFPEFFRHDRDGRPRGVIRVVQAGRT